MDQFQIPHSQFPIQKVVLLTLLICSLAGCGGASGDGHPVRNEKVDPSRDRENKEASLVPRMSVEDMVGQMFIVSMGVLAILQAVEAAPKEELDRARELLVRVVQMSNRLIARFSRTAA